MRVKTNNNPWLSSPQHSGLVDIKTHSLWASISGPIRKPNSPLLIFFPGAGAAAAEYMHIQRGLSPFMRSLFWDRAGYDQSTLPPENKSGERILATDTARDLTKLLAVTGLEPPYILAAHSFGGILARTFLQTYISQPAVIQALLLFDTATELMLSLFPRVPPLEFQVIAENLDIEKLTHLKEESGLTDEEFEYIIAANQRSAYALSLEDTHASAYQLALHRQLDLRAMDPRPVTVIQCNMMRDFKLVYDAGVKMGNGTKEERKAVRDFVEKWGCFHGQIARAQMGLSGKVKFRFFEEWGHDLPIRRPEMVVDEVRGLLKKLEKEDGTARSGHEGVFDVDMESRRRANDMRSGEGSPEVRTAGILPAMSFLG